jgi:adenine deaminase
MIAPGRYADILMVTELSTFDVEWVMARGQVVAECGSLSIPLPQVTYPDWALRSVLLQRPLTVSDFRLAAEDGRTSVMANVIGVIENQAPTRHIRMEMRLQDGEVRADMTQDVAKVALVERHTGSGQVKVGLVQGFGFNQLCAVASTVAHDSHQMIVVGTDDENMAIAANALAECNGGQVVVRNRKVVGKVELPIAGLMSDERAEIVARKAASVLKGFASCGCTLNNPNMQLSLLGLVVIPALRISDRGLVDVSNFRFIPVLE